MNVFAHRFAALLAALAMSSVLSATATAAPDTTKLDAALTGIAQHGINRTVSPKMLRIEPGQAEPLVQTILRFEGSLDAVRAQGGIVRSVMGDIATVDIPASKLAAIAALPSVVSIEAARPQQIRLDVSVPATRADALRTGVPGNWTGGTGKGVIVGIVDDGVDFRHPDFRHADGTTRILGLWDQRTTGAAGSPPAGFSYGGECTTAMINAAIGGDAAACTQPSSGGHGTHVAGIAAGTGQATGNGQIGYRMIGMAPDADLLVANTLGADGTDTALLDAMAYMKARAAALGKPLVINLSLGSYFGARDGTSNFERGEDNVSGPGVILVAAAGNEGNAPIRATGTIAQGGSVSVGYDIPASASRGVLEIWYPGTNAYGVSVTGPGCAATAPVNPGDPVAQIETPCGSLQITSTGTQANNDDRQITIVIVGAAGVAAPKPGTWTLTLIGTTVAGGSAPFSIIGGEDASGATFSTNTSPVTTEIVTNAASAKRVIGVAAYSTRFTWNSLAGAINNPNMFGPLTDISDFSSRGPRRNCSNLAKCPAVMKPEITAPGAMIMAAYAGDTAKPSAQTRIEADGVHVAFNGTSMATPHVSGAVALMLQVDPTLTPEAVKQRMFSNVQTNGFSTNLPTFNAATPDMPANPNYTWGYGIMDAAAAVRSLQPAGTPVNVIEFYNQSLDHYFITWVADEIAKLDSGQFKGWARTGQAFKVYSGAQAGTTAVCRIYIPPGKGDGHFFGRDKNECDGTMAKNPTFNLESSTFFYLIPPNLGTCAAGTVPVYRVYSNRADANHRYTTDRATRDQMVAKGWAAEGDGPDIVVMCAPQ
ncbi:MAG: S8 family serine peptidase [Casimicrobiaceae bacterium]